MLTDILILAAGFAALIIGANWLVGGASSLSARMGISELMIGLTVVAFGTSTPELVVNIVASVNGYNEVVIGNIIGSNLFNLLFILGISGIILPVVVQHKTVWLEIPVSFTAAIMVLVLARTGGPGTSNRIGQTEGIVLLTLFLAFLLYIFISMKRTGKPKDVQQQKPAWISLMFVAMGLAGLVFGGRMVVTKSIEVASSFGMSEKLIGLTIVSIGTSLPELATSVIAAIKKNSDMVIGNIIGSNIFNIFLILGTCSVIKPIQLPQALYTDIVLLGAFTVLLFVGMFTSGKKKLDRWESALLLTAFIGYMVFIIGRN